MADHINPNIKNRLSPKDIIKRTAALTLLLSMTACSLASYTIVDYIYMSPLIYLGVHMAFWAFKEISEGIKKNNTKK